MSISKDLSELQEAGVIDQGTADRIHDYYAIKSEPTTNRLFVAFGILGAALVGLGIILILAHNWDQLSRSTKTVIAFLPLVVGQALCGFALFKKQNSNAWKESTATFLFFTVGASISLVGQIYNIPGDIGSFILTWMLLCLPLVYVMQSSIVSLLYLMGITYHAWHIGYWSYPYDEPYLYWVLLLGIIPYYYLLYKRNRFGNSIRFFHWLVPTSVAIVLGTLANQADQFMFIAYFSLLGLYYLIGQTQYFKHQSSRNYGYKVIGSLGSIVLLLSFSFDPLWRELNLETLSFSKVILTPEFLAAFILTSLAGVIYIFQVGKLENHEKLTASAFILFIFTFLVEIFAPVGAVIVNVFVLGLGVLTVLSGARQDSLGKLNYGLLIMAALVVCRFFDTDLSFVVRGVLFVLVGAGFFGVNYWMLKKRKGNA